MPIILTLTDDQALDIVSQVSSLLKPGALSGHRQVIISSRKTYVKQGAQTYVSMVRDYISKFNSGATFKTKEIRLAIGPRRITEAAVSYALRVLRKEGIIRPGSAKRGLWEKV